MNPGEMDPEKFFNKTERRMAILPIAFLFAFNFINSSKQHDNFFNFDNLLVSKAYLQSMLCDWF